MKSFVTLALSGLALLQPAAALCCRKDQCLKAVVAPDHYGAADCAANLVHTVTLPVSTVTKTTTAVVDTVSSAVARFTEVKIASNKTIVITLSTEKTATTETSTLTAFATVPETTTVTETAATTTTTVDVYQRPILGRRGASSAPAGALPSYASGVCDTYDQYVNACHCVGVTATTITVPGATTTVTLPAASTITSVSVVSTSIVDVVLSTSTTVTTTTDTLLLTASATTTETDTVTSTATASATVTATSTVEQQCQQTGLSFRVSTPFNDDTTRFMDIVAGSIPAWQTFPENPSQAQLEVSTWAVDSEGFMWLPAGNRYIYIDSRSSGPTGTTRNALAGDKAAVDAGVAAGTFVKIQGCVDTVTNELYMRAGERTMIYSCGNTLYLTSVPAPSNCVLLTPTVANTGATN